MPEQACWGQVRGARHLPAWVIRPVYRIFVTVLVRNPLRFPRRRYAFFAFLIVQVCAYITRIDHPLMHLRFFRCAPFITSSPARSS